MMRVAKVGATHRMQGAVALLLLCFIHVVGAQALPAVPLKYQFKGMNEVSYQVTIKAELPDATETRSGMIQYQIKSVDAASGEISFGYTAALGLERKSKTANRGFPGAPPMMMPPFPFARGMAMGLPDIVITPQGKVVRSNRTDDVSQLPYALGLEWELLLPMLSIDAKDTWKQEHTLLLSAKSGRNNWPPMGPWGAEERVDRPAHERITYTAGPANGAIVPITRQYDLSSDEKVGDSPRLRQSGQSQIMFDTDTGTVQSMEAKYTIEVNDNNMTVKVPVTVSARPYTAEELAKQKAAREAQAAKAKAQLEKMQADQAAEKAMDKVANRTPEIGNGHGTQFIRADVKLRPVIGLRIAIGDWMGRKCIKKIEPLWEKPADAETDSNTTVLMARQGYAVGGLVFNMAEAPRKDLYGMQVIFMHLDKSKLDKSDAYRSQWFADVDAKTPKIVLGGKGEMVVGMFGREFEDLNCVGLYLKDPKAGEQKIKDGEKSPDEINADSLPKDR